MQLKLLKIWAISIVKNFLVLLKIYNRCNKNCFKREQFKKQRKATGDLIGNKIVDKIRNISRKSSIELNSQNNEANDEIEIP